MLNPLHQAVYVLHYRLNRDTLEERHVFYVAAETGPGECTIWVIPKEPTACKLPLLPFDPDALGSPTHYQCFEASGVNIIPMTTTHGRHRPRVPTSHKCVLKQKSAQPLALASYRGRALCPQ